MVTILKCYRWGPSRWESLVRPDNPEKPHPSSERFSSAPRPASQRWRAHRQPPRPTQAAPLRVRQRVLSFGR
ncbi:MAG TPA: hypothetical protein DCR50_17900, partial [Afipia sp.]|nr:hypothetical protein [Afipia sp.]